MSKNLWIVFACLLTAGLTACQPSPEASPDASREATDTATTTEPSSGETETPNTGDGEVTYEPAYPAEVSNEGLEPADVLQQPTDSHSHGDEGDHTHEGDGDLVEDEHGH